MRFPVPAPKPVSIRSPRWLVGSIAVSLAFILVAADSAVPNAHDPGVSRLTPVVDAEVDTPEQEDGSADGLSHEWEADEPESDGSGRPPDAVDPPDGALPHEWPELPEDAEPDAPPEDKARTPPRAGWMRRSRTPFATPRRCPERTSS